VRAIAALGQALDHDETCVTVTELDWARVASISASISAAARPRPLFDEIPEYRHVALAVADVPASSLQQRLGALPALERERALLELIRTEAAAVLGMVDPRTLPSERPLSELGLDSLMAVELRNRLAAATALRLPTTLLFDHPTPRALTHLLATRLFEPERIPQHQISPELDQLERSLLAMTEDAVARPKVVMWLQSLLSRVSQTERDADAAGAGDFEAASDDELFAAFDRRLGKVEP
jgi:hypothetical protein